MSNTTNPETWAALERLRSIERSLWWRGQVKRRDLREAFGISLAQASSDVQRYLELNPVAARYDLKAKTYWGEPHMECRLHAPRLEEALALYLGGSGGLAASTMALASPSLPTPVAARVAFVALPAREAVLAVQRASFFAVYQELRLRIDYGSLSGRREVGWRWIVPRAFGHNGYRWHLRAWCEENRDYRDFVLSRIRQTEWPKDAAGIELPKDEDWDTWEELTLVANPALPEDQRNSIEADFGILAGKLRLPVRRAMLDYTLDHLRLRSRGGKQLPQMLKLDDA